MFLVDTGAQLVLVDTGFPGSAQAILEEIDEVLPDRRLDLILLTHAHRDHSGSARELRRATGAKVVAGAADTREARPGRWVTSERRRPRRLVTKTARMLMRKPVGIHRSEVDERLEGEVEVAPGIVAVPTPGHSPGSYCFVLESQQIAFVGDLIIEHSDRLVRPMALANSDDRQFLESLTAFSKIAPSSGCPGHGKPVFETFGDELRELAELPRRSLLSPRLLRDRAARLSGFSRRVATRRR